MKTGASGINTGLPNEITSLARLWSIAPANGDTPIRFTDHDQDIIYSGDTYSCEIGFEASSIVTATNSLAQGVTISLALDDSITGSRIRAGYFDLAVVALQAIDYTAPTNGTIKLFNGSIGDIVFDDIDHVTFNIQGKFNSQVYITVESYSSLCRADLGDTRCKFNIESLKETFTVSSVVNAQVFDTDELNQVDDFWQFGILQFDSGDNAGIAMEVANSDSSSKSITTFLASPFNVQVGDTGIIYPGCNKTIVMCHDRYNNLLNFRGEPYNIIKTAAL